MTINTKKLKTIAKDLEASLNAYTGNDMSVLEIRDALYEIIESAKNEVIQNTVSRNDIPGVYQWKNSGMGWPKDIRDNYFEFRKEISGGQRASVKKFLGKLDKNGHIS